MFVNTATTNQSRSNSEVEVMNRQSQPQLQQQGQGAVMPGFRFHPTDEELVGYYLRRQIVHRSPAVDVITQLDIYKFDPWDLPKMSALKGEKEWYFFCPRDRKYRNSARPNRVTGAGFWKATGTDRPIYSNDANKCIGLKKSLVFYTGRAAKSTKTDWMMHEFRMPASSEASTLGRVQIDEATQQKDSWAVCRIFKKSTLAQRHAPPYQQWEMMELHQTPVGASAPSFVMPRSECTSSPDLEHDTSSQERSDTTSEDLEVEGSIPRTTQDPLLDYSPPRVYTTAATHVQQPQPQQQLKQEQTLNTIWPVTVANSMEELLQETSTARSNVLQQRSHMPSEMYPMEMQNLFVQDQPSMKGALEYVSCIINPSQSGTQFVGSNFDNSIRSGESMNMIQSLDSILSWVEPRMSTPLDIFRKELTEQSPHERQLPQSFVSTHPWD